MTNEQSERNRLILELREIGMVSFVHQVADYIIADRKRICGPILRFKGTNEYIDEALKLAGIGEHDGA